MASLRESTREALGMGWILDTDTTVKLLYGRQDGADISYNPIKPGRPSHLSARAVALIYNWWSWYVRLAHPKARLEAITSRPLLLASCAERSRNSRHGARSFCKARWRVTLLIRPEYNKACQLDLHGDPHG